MAEIALPAPSAGENPIYTVKVTNENAQSPPSFKPGKYLQTKHIWIPLFIYAKLTTSAVVANRTLQLQLYSENNFNSQVLTSGNVAASSTLETAYMDIKYVSSTDLINYDLLAGIDPLSWCFQGDDLLRLVTGNVQTGDVIEVRGRFRYMNWSWGINKYLEGSIPNTGLPPRIDPRFD